MKTIKNYIAINILVLSTQSVFSHQSAPNPVVPRPGLSTQQVKEIAGKSSCAKTNWISRGRAPTGFMKGVALSYARSLCRIKYSGALKPAAKILMSSDTRNAKKDVLTHYQDILARLGMRTNVSGEEPLLATYTIGLGLGMKESSGKYCEGWDVAAGSNRKSSEAEAGLFQASYNSMSTSVELKLLYDEYKANPNRCLLDVFQEGVSCKARGILGGGAGAEYQAFTKACPAFATEYAMTLIRILRSHFGPLNRKTAQVAPACESMLTSVQKLIESNTDIVCSELQ